VFNGRSVASAWQLALQTVNVRVSVELNFTSGLKVTDQAAVYFRWPNEVVQREFPQFAVRIDRESTVAVEFDLIPVVWGRRDIPSVRLCREFSFRSGNCYITGMVSMARWVHFEKQARHPGRPLLPGRFKIPCAKVLGLA
jgi:hypothetical protein